MAAPSYTTDLTLIHACDAASASWTEPTGFAAGGITLPETDYFIQNTGCLSKNCGTTTPAGVGAIFNVGSGITVPSPGAVMTWLFFGAPNTLNTQLSGGLQVFVGSGTGAFKQWYVRGSDTYPYGGWICVPVDPSIAADTQTGSPTSTTQYFGAGAQIPGPGIASKGNPFGIDILRYGRCEARLSGGDVGNGYCTFNGFAATNDSLTNRWGLVQAVQGGYLVQGLVILGYLGAIDFRDSNKSILIANTEKVAAGFNAFEVRNASSRVDLTAISFTALGTVSKGNWITTDNADINITGCTFTDMGTFGFLSNSTILNSTFRRTGQITTGGATFTGCTIDSNAASSAMVASSPANAALISNTAFTSDGTGHAIEITGTAANMTLTNNTYSNYAATDGSTGNEAVFVNILSGSMNLTITGGGVPSVRTAGCSVTIIAGAVNATVNVKDINNNNINDARVIVLAATGGPMPYDVTVTLSGSGTTATVTHTAHGMATNDKVQIKGANEIEYNGVFSITKINNDSYSYTMTGTPASPGTGTIKATYCALFGLTASGTITMSRVFTSNQPISGRVRKSTGSPIYKTGIVSGTIDSSLGFSTTVLLISDE